MLDLISECSSVYGLSPANMQACHHIELPIPPYPSRHVYSDAHWQADKAMWHR